MSALTQARAAVGGLSRPSKMPGPSYNLPASACKTGGKLQKVKGSVCADCYACKGRYLFGNVQNALNRRLKTIASPNWVTAMANAIDGAPYFRWHDSGDIQSIEHLARIVEVARLTPNTRHWLPTREKQIVKEYCRTNIIPENLVIRISAAMIDGSPPVTELPTSTVHTADAIGYECPAPKQANKCGDCRACWDVSIKNVSYRAH